MEGYKKKWQRRLDWAEGRRLARKKCEGEQEEIWRVKVWLR